MLSEEEGEELVPPTQLLVSSCWVMSGLVVETVLVMAY